MSEGQGAEAPWPAPAKLNLMLRVVGRRDDGYHLLQTLFQFIDLCDELRFEPRLDGGIRLLTGTPGVPAQADLVVRAAHLLQQHTGCGLGANIRIHKRLPLGGGLGGGSSDAATTLVALNQLWRTGVGDDDLAALGLRLGADVPVFVRGRSAWGEGVGEELQPVDPARPWYLVLKPECHVPTSEIFADPELTRDSCRITIADFIAGADRNDCLPVVRKRYPLVERALEWLSRHGEPRLTGTGACVFAAFEHESGARMALRSVPADIDAFVARGLNRSPLLDRLSLDR